MTITGKARLAGVMGWPVSHSRSPLLHNHWLDEYGIDGAYVPLAVAPDRFESALRALGQLGFAGANVTVPHKEAALRSVDEASPAARRIGAVNTIVIGADGRVAGDNSDGFGFLNAIGQAAPFWRPGLGPAVVVGAGGAARAILAALQDTGAPEIRLVNRSPARAEALAGEFGAPIRAVRWDERRAVLDGAALLVNATTLGMTGHPPLDLPLDALPPDAVVNDVVYAPLRTPLLEAAAARGNPAVDGLGMLLHQARPGFAAWFGREPEVTAAARRLLAEDLAQ